MIKLEEEYKLRGNMNIKGINLKYGVMLAPMAGFTDRAMRLVCHMHGAEYSVTEMVSAKAVCFGDKKTHALARIKKDEGPCAVQIFGSEPDIMAHAAEVLSSGEDGGVPPSAIDINMGCPVHKVYSNGEGSALMKNPDLIYKIVERVSKSIDVPCTVKMRAGIDENSKNAVECALAAEAAGAAAVTVHGRTRVEMYSGQVDEEIIKNVKSSLHIPVIANGDITSGEEALRILSYTGADGIMVGRGAIGNPFVFSEIICALSGGNYTFPTLEERVESALLQLSVAIIEKGEIIAVRESRKQAAMYIKAFRGAAGIRAEINRAETYEDVKRALYTALEKKDEEI